MILRSHLTSLSLVLVLSACSSSGGGSSKSTEQKYLGLTIPTATEGFQVRSHGTDVQPNEDVEYCEVAELPGDPSTTYYVNRLEFGNGEHSHHLIINTADVGSDAEKKLAAMEIGKPVACLGSSTLVGAQMEFTGGIQRPYGDIRFPAGVGRVYHGGQRIVFDYHYYNTGDTPVHAASAVNYYLTDEADVKHIATVVSFANMTIDTPPNGTGKFVGECKYNQDVMVNGVTRHTHKWGTDFNVWYAGGADDGKEFFTSKNFEEEVDHPFTPARLMKAGEGFRFECDYTNNEDRHLRFGLNATDEMCILFSLVWEANEGEQLKKQDCTIVQVGDDGIGRPVDPTQGFRPPTPAEVSACLAAPTSMDATCSQCACNACGGVIADCANDTDCKALLDCVQTTHCNQNTCTSVCADAFNVHSSGIGPLIQVSSCLGTECKTTCQSLTGGAGDAGAPMSSDGGAR